MLKKICSFMIAGLVGACVLAGCGKTTGNKEDAKQKEGSKTITIGMPTAWKEWGGIDQLIQEWADETGNKVDIQAGEDTQFMQQLTAKLVTGECWDIVFTSCGATALNLSPEKNFTITSDAPWVENVSQLAKDALTFDGEMHGAPFSGTSAMGIVYNKQVFEDLNLSVPTTMEEFNNVCKVIKEAGIVPVYISGADGWTISQAINGAWANIAKANPGIMDKLNKNEIRWDEIPEFVEYCNLWYEQGQLEYYNEDMATATYAMAIEEIASGRAAMTYQGTWASAELLKIAPDGLFGMFAVPTAGGEACISQGAPYAIYVYNDSPNKEAAEDLVNYLCEQKNLKKFYEKKPDVSVWNNVVSEQLDPLSADANEYAKNGQAQVHWNDVYCVPYSDEISQIFMEAFLGMKTGEEVASEFADFCIKSGKQVNLEGFR